MTSARSLLAAAGDALLDERRQLKPEELVDLFSLLILDRPPEDPQAKLLPGASEVGSKTK